MPSTQLAVVHEAKTMRWCADDELAQLMRLPDGYTIERIHRQGIAEAIGHLRSWYPDISVGTGSAYFRSDFYENEVTLFGGREKNIAVWIFRYQGEMVGIWCNERVPEARAIHTRLGVFAPSHRNTQVVKCVAASARARAMAQGADCFYANATLRHPAAQLGLERAGFKLVGFTPGFDLEVFPDGSIKRVHEAVYVLHILGEDTLYTPEAKNLSPQVKALYDAVFTETSVKDLR